MDKRFFLALLLTGAVVVVTPVLFPGRRAPTPVTPVPAAPGQSATVTVNDSGGERNRSTPANAMAKVADAPVEAHSVFLENALARYEFTTRGAALLSAELPRYRRLNGNDGIARLADGQHPLLHYRLIVAGDTIALDRLGFDATSFEASSSEGGGQARATFSAAAGTGRVHITYLLAPANYLLDVSVRTEGFPAPAFLLTDLPSGFESQERDTTDDHQSLAYAMHTPAKGAERVDFRTPEPGERILRAGPFSWAVAKNKYFLVGLLAQEGVASPLAELQVTGEMREKRVAVRARAAVVSPIGPEGVKFELYAGPQEWERLVAMGREFQNANPYGGWVSGVVQPFATIVMRVLLWMKRTLRIEYGWILVIFGVSIRLAMWPLNSRMMRSSLQMQRIAPQVQAAQAKYRDDPAKQRDAVMKVYSDAGLSPFAPLAGCLPMLLPMPILFALFFVFKNTIEFRGVSFLWLPDISVADPYYILPLVMGGSMYLLSWIGARNVPPNPQAKMMSIMMPIMMVVLLFNFASGLNLYYAVQNIAALPQQWLISNERAKAQLATAKPDGGTRPRR